MHAWYLLDENQPRSGAANMAVDQLLLERVESGALNRPVLRLYGWQTATLSLGYHQKWEQTVDLDALQAHQIDLVRRWTGGRAVLHDADEVTYSVVAPIQPPFKSQVSHNYKLLGTALEAFADLSDVAAKRASDQEPIRAEMVPCRSKDTSKPQRLNASPCFASLSEYEIERGGKKMIGSAQKLSKHGFLQHGSMPMTARTDVLEVVTGSTLDMSSLMTSLSDHWLAFGLPKPDRAEVTQRLIAAFQRKLNLSFSPLPKQLISEADIENRISERFGNRDWVFRK